MNAEFEYPVIAEADVVVCGAGPGGLGAAYMAAQQKLNVLVIESSGKSGGMAANSEVMPFMPSTFAGEYVDAPVYALWLKGLYEYQTDENKKILDEAAPLDARRRFYTAAMAALAAEDILLDAGVKILYHHTVTGCVKSGSCIDALTVHSKSGFGMIKGKVFVDCTGDADLAALAGVPFEYGDADGLCQPMTTCFKLGNLKPPYSSFRTPEYRRLYQKLHAEAQARGELSCPREDMLLFSTLYDDTAHFNTTRVCGHHATDGISRSEAEIIARKQVREYLKWLRRCVPGFENAELISLGELGVRESRRVLGQYYLTCDEIVSCCKFPDAIARCNYIVDIHSPTGSGTVRQTIPEGDFYEIPYRCVVPQKIENLTIGGRPVSADVAAHSSLRIMPTACSIGQGAGMGAALAVRQNCTPADVDGQLVKEELKKAGAKL